MTKLIQILIIEHSLPFYHVPAWELLGSHPKIELTIAFGRGYFTAGKHGVPEGVIPDPSTASYYGRKIVRSFFKKKILWHSHALMLLKKNKYDIVIHQAETKILSIMAALILARIKKTKFVLWGIGNPLSPSKVLDKYRRFLAKITDGFIFYSEVNIPRYLEWGIDSNKLYVARNSIDVQSIISLSTTWNPTEIEEFRLRNGLEKFTILTIGRLLDRKKMDWLIKAVSQINYIGSRVNLVIIGNGPEYNNLKQLVMTLGLSNDVIFTGKLVGNENIAPWFLSADIVVAPAQVGHLATEAHAYGKPIILSDDKSCQGPESNILMPGITGLLYKHGSISDLENRIISLLESSNLEDIYKMA